MEYREIPLESIKVGAYNLRGEKAATSQSLERLSTSIWEEGLLHPLGVIANGDGTSTLVYGHRRYWAITNYLLILEDRTKHPGEELAYWNV